MYHFSEVEVKERMVRMSKKIGVCFMMVIMTFDIYQLIEMLLRNK